MKKVMIVLPELSNTGAPNSGYNMALVLRKIGFHPCVYSKVDGIMRHRFEEMGIPIKVTENVLDYTLCAKQVEICIVNTSMLYELAIELQKYTKTVLIIREAKSIKEFAEIFGCSLERLSLVKNIFTVSEYARREVKKELGIETRILHNYSPDYICKNKPKAQKKYITFGILGTIEPRKAIKLCVEAFVKYGHSSEVRLLVGGRLLEWQKEYWEELLQIIEVQNYIEYIGEVTSFDEKENFYERIDVMIIASEDESCSLVALEAACRGKYLILSKNVGAKYLVGRMNGKVFETGDIESLIRCIEKACDYRFFLGMAGKLSRLQYKKYASEQRYIKEIKKMFNTLI